MEQLRQRNSTKIIIVLLLYSMSSYTLAANHIDSTIVGQQEYEAVLEKIKKLEDELKDTRKEFTITRESVKEHVKDKYEDWFASHSWLLFFGASMVGFFGAFTSLKNRFNKKADEIFKVMSEKADKKVKSLIEVIVENRDKAVAKFAESKKEAILKHVEKCERINRLKTTKRIIVLNQQGTGASSEFKKIITSFSKRKFQNLEELAYANKINYNDYDAVIIENADQEGVWNITKKDNSKGNQDIRAFNEKVKENINHMIAIANNACSKGTVLIYYGHGRFPKINSAYQHLMNFANSPAQLLGNLINLLEYQDTLQSISEEELKNVELNTI